MWWRVRTFSTHAGASGFSGSVGGVGFSGSTGVSGTGNAGNSGLMEDGEPLYSRAYQRMIHLNFLLSACLLRRAQCG